MLAPFTNSRLITYTWHDTTASIKAVRPLLSFSSTSAPAFKRSSTVGYSPWKAALMSDVLPSLSNALTSQPSLIKALAASFWPFLQAPIKAVRFFLSLALTFAPFSNRTFTTSVLPLFAHLIKTDLPSPLV